MDDEFTIELRDGFGNIRTFEGVDELEGFLEAEEQAWSWVSEVPHTYARLNAVPVQVLNNIRGWIVNLRNGSWTPADFASNLNGVYSGTQPQLLLSDVAPGANVNLIREAFDDAHAELALALLTPAPQRPDVRDDLRAAKVWQMLALPTVIGQEAWAAEHRRKLGNMRAVLAREASAVRANEEKRAGDAAGFLADQRKLYRHLLAQAARLGSRRADNIAQRARSAIEKIETTEAAYSLQMGLAAPVRYWRTKQRTHGKAATRWGIALMVYAVAVIVAFSLAVPAVWEAVPDNEGLTGRHFILVAAIGAALTTFFWIARVLIRIYLGERHLATDAEERRVMTQAYLALMKGDAASNDERSIILAALFRTAQDGIVREEGVGDVGLPAMIARLLDGRK